jgi:hypothetical protein
VPRRSTPKKPKRRRRPARERPTREPPPERVDWQALYRERAQQRNEEARAKLVPLAEGERPLAVTVGAAVALLIALSNVVLIFVGDDDGSRPPLVGQLLFVVLMLAAAWGMWKARYWAVLGMQALLALGIIVFFFLLVTAKSVLAAVFAMVMLAGAGTLFWFLVKSLARIQMPERT